jgi:hypothetical protein
LVRLDDHRLIASFQKNYSCGKDAGNLLFYVSDNEKEGAGWLGESMVVLTAFGMIRSEKAKRDTVWEILQGIAENAG